MAGKPTLKGENTLVPGDRATISRIHSSNRPPYALSRAAARLPPALGRREGESYPPSDPPSSASASPSNSPSGSSRSSVAASGRTSAMSPADLLLESGGLSLSRPHLAANTGGESARDTILTALHVLEKENQVLRKTNSDMVSNMEILRHENEELRREFELSQSEIIEFAKRVKELELANRDLTSNLDNQAKSYVDELERYGEIESKLKEDNFRCKNDLENLRNQLIKKESEVRNIYREMEDMQKLVEKVSRNTSDRDIELFHELQLLKSERKDLALEREELQKVNKKLSNEVKNLESKLDEKESELRNENRRHSLLTKEFNSLLQENNQLKQQLRRRSSILVQANNFENGNTTLTGNKDSNGVSTPRKFNSTSSLARQGSFIAPNGSQMRRDYTIVSREWTTLSRNRASVEAPPRDESPSRRTETTMTSVRKLTARGTNVGMDQSDSGSGSKSDTLPSIHNSNGKMWKP